MTLIHANIIPLSKVCSRCECSKVLSDFPLEKRNKSGYSGVCRSCKNEQSRNWSKANKEKSSFNQSEWRKRNAETMRRHREKWAKLNPEKIKEARRIYSNLPHIKEKQRLWNKNNKHKHRFYTIKHKYGLTIDGYQNLLELQEGRCCICEQNLVLANKKTHIDHCHSTGKIRGLLCQDCNRGLGGFKDNEASLRNAINYLLRSRMV